MTSNSWMIELKELCIWTSRCNEFNARFNCINDSHELHHLGLNVMYVCIFSTPIVKWLQSNSMNLPEIYVSHLPTHKIQDSLPNCMAVDLRNFLMSKLHEPQDTWKALGRDLLVHICRQNEAKWEALSQIFLWDTDRSKINTKSITLGQ